MRQGSKTKKNNNSVSGDVRMKQVFSISKKYDIVLKILDGLENKSEYICQAIIQKARYPMPKDTPIDTEAVEEIVRRVLDEYISTGKMTTPVASVTSMPTINSPTEELTTDGDLVPKTTVMDVDDDALFELSQNW